MWWHQEGLKDEEGPGSLLPELTTGGPAGQPHGMYKELHPPFASCAHLKWYLLSVATPTVSPLTPSASKREGREIATLKEEEGLEDGRVLPRGPRFPRD